MKVILSTVGTSIWQHSKEHDGNAVWMKIQQMKRDGEVSNVSAEIKVLHKLHLTEQDVLYFATSDTDEGEQAGELVAKFAEDCWGCIVDVQRIKGVKMDRPSEFQTTGIKNLVDWSISKIEQYLEKPLHEQESGIDVRMNINGGFKSSIPYMVLISLMYGMKIHYSFERSDALMTLPLAPLTFDEQALKKVSPFIHLVYGRRATSEELSPYGFSFEQVPLTAGVLIKERNAVTLSPVAEVFYRRFLKNEGYELQIMPDAARKLASGRYDTKKYEDIFERMRDKEHLEAHIHTHHSFDTSCRCYKRYGSDERVFYKVKGNVLEIHEITSHATDYEELLRRGKLNC